MKKNIQDEEKYIKYLQRKIKNFEKNNKNHSVKYDTQKSFHFPTRIK